MQTKKNIRNEDCLKKNTINNKNPTLKISKIEGFLFCSKIKNDIADELSLLAIKQKSIKLLLNKPIKIKHKKPEINPKLIKP